MQDDTRKPVWIKYYGLIPMTRRGYLITLAVVCVGVAAVFVVGLALGRLPPFRWPWDPLPLPNTPGLGAWLYNHLYEFLLVALLLEGIDIFVILRRFADKEAEQRARRSDSNPHL